MQLRSFPKSSLASASTPSGVSLIRDPRMTFTFGLRLNLSTDTRVDGPLLLVFSWEDIDDQPVCDRGNRR